MKYREELEYISVAETKAKLSEKLTRVDTAGRRFAITSHGRPKAVILAYKDYCALADKVSNCAVEPREIELIDMKDSDGVVRSITSLFEPKLLTQKGQKEYKRAKVQKKRFDVVNVKGSSLRMISVEDLIVDRLCAFKFWKSGIDGVNAMILLERDLGDRKRIEARASEEDVLDTLDYIENAREEIIRKRLPQKAASEMLMKYFKKK